MLNYFKAASPGIYPVTPDQVDLIKEYWETLHVYTGAEFTFNEEFNKIRKDECTRTEN